MTDEIVEEWRPVIGYEGWYEVSDLGRVRRVKMSRGARAGAIRKQHLDVKGYYRTTLCRDGSPSTVLVHRLVAAAFIASAIAGMEVNHKNADKTRNVPSNLEILTSEQHHQETMKMKLYPRGENRSNAKLSDADIYRIRSFQGEKRSQLVAEQFGISRSHVTAIWRREFWSHLPETQGS